MTKTRLILITNPGSSSRKYALYRDSEFLCALHFEFEKQSVVCTLKRANGTKKKLPQDFKTLATTVSHINEILSEEGYLPEGTKIDVVLARVAAPGTYFAEDHIVDKEYLKKLEDAKKKAPLHVPVVAGEIEHFVKIFEGTPILSISDSSFHNSRPDVAKYYAFDTELADKTDVKKYGYHGLSVGSIVKYMEGEKILPEKMIVCHIGSGSSVTAVFRGKSYDTTMGYTPLEGVMMSTRAGSMDVAAALAIKRELEMNDEDFEKYLNKECGLKGVSGKTDDMREIIELEEKGDKRAKFAHELYGYRIRAEIGRMAAAMNGVDAIVMTATIGERSKEDRELICNELEYLGFSLDDAKNKGEMVERHTNIATENSKPIYVIRTDEFEEMIRKATMLLDK
ncbi:hypothetical protein IJI02_00310 [Candidatus Saccharibacteria bacterium]|nr:hypothetical protein [Candidatus Saccharibacteria bacterium]